MIFKETNHLKNKETIHFRIKDTGHCIIKEGTEQRIKKKNLITGELKRLIS